MVDKINKLNLDDVEAVGARGDAPVFKLVDDDELALVHRGGLNALPAYRLERYKNEYGEMYYKLDTSPLWQMVAVGVLKGIIPVAEVIYDRKGDIFVKQCSAENKETILQELSNWDNFFADLFLLYCVLGDGDHILYSEYSELNVRNIFLLIYREYVYYKFYDFHLAFSKFGLKARGFEAFFDRLYLSFEAIDNLDYCELSDDVRDFGGLLLKLRRGEFDKLPKNNQVIQLINQKLEQLAKRIEGEAGEKYVRDIFRHHDWKVLVKLMRDDKISRQQSIKQNPRWHTKPDDLVKILQNNLKNTKKLLAEVTR